MHSKMTGLARRVHDVSTVKEKFDALVQQDKELEGNKTALDRHVKTRWNLDFLCLDAHLHFRGQVEALTAPTTNKLRAYHLTGEHWDLAEILHDILKVSIHYTRVSILMALLGL